MKTRDKVIIGAALGAGVAAFLFSTKTGKKLRKQICEKTDGLLDEALHKFQEETQISTFDDAADKVMDFAVKNRDSITGLIQSLLTRRS